MDTAPKSEFGVGFTARFTRSFAAPRELMFKLWTDAEHLAKWWGPAGFTNPVCEFDPRPGGRIYIEMTGPDGTSYPLRGEVREVVAPERLVFLCVCCVDDKGTAGVESLETVTFHEENGGTRVEIETRITKIEDFARDALDGMEQGWNESLDRLAALAES